MWSQNDLIWCGLSWKYLFNLRNTVVQLQVPHDHKLRAVRIPFFFIFFLYLLLITSCSGEECFYGKAAMEMPIRVLCLDNIFHEVCMWPFPAWRWEQEVPPRIAMQRQHKELCPSAVCSGHLGGTQGKKEQHRTFCICIQAFSSYV